MCGELLVKRGEFLRCFSTPENFPLLANLFLGRGWFLRLLIEAGLLVPDKLSPGTPCPSKSSI
jgi:hypothetical protein